MENQQQLISDILKVKWTRMEIFIPLMSKYLHHREILDGYSADDVLKIMLESLSVIFGELNNTLGKLNKYEPKHYTHSDFVDMVIDSIGEEPPDKNDKEGIIKYVEDFRCILWGHTNYHTNKYFKLYADSIKDKTKETNPEDFIEDLRECMTIVMVECLLRATERKAENL